MGNVCAISYDMGGDWFFCVLIAFGRGIIISSMIIMRSSMASDGDIPYDKRMRK